MNRRDYLKLTTGLALAMVVPAVRGRELPPEADESDLIYLTPLRSDGTESRCQAEVWFVRDGDAFVVVTAADAWRAKAVDRGLTATRIWIGDVGVWDASAKYKALFEVQAEGQRVGEAVEHARLLERFGDKYSLEWLVWGPRFRNGLADGTRVMLRYQVA